VLSIAVQIDIVHANYFASVNIDYLLVEEIPGEQKVSFYPRAGGPGISSRSRAYATVDF
jgi:hypothetical protein